MNTIRSAYATCLLVLASILGSDIAHAAAPSRGLVAEALQGRRECVRFRWETGEKGEAHAGIDVPAVIDGKPVWLQLDTGADYDVLYGKLAIEQVHGQSATKGFRPASIRIGGTAIDRPYMALKPEIKDQSTSGTFGLADIIGRVAVIDYVGEQFCLFAEADAPSRITDVALIPAILRNGKLFLPVKTGGFSSENVIFDTGSSQFPLIVDLGPWRTLTGLTEPTRAPLKVEGSSWGQPITVHGAPSLQTMNVGATALGRLGIYTLPGDPDGFAHWPFKAEGIVGNAPFIQGLVVLDMTGRVAFGYTS